MKKIMMILIAMMIVFTSRLTVDFSKAMTADANSKSTDKMINDSLIVERHEDLAEISEGKSEGYSKIWWLNKVKADGAYSYGSLAKGRLNLETAMKYVKKLNTKGSCKGIETNKTSLYLDKNETFTIDFDLKQRTVGAAPYVSFSSNKSVASVDKTGTVRAIGRFSYLTLVTSTSRQHQMLSYQILTQSTSISSHPRICLISLEEGFLE